MAKSLLARYAELYRTYHTLIYLSVIAAVAELAYAVMNQSAIPPYLEVIGLKAQVGIVIGMFLVVEAVLKSPMGSLGDRLGRRPLIVVGALLSCVTALLMTVVRGMPGLITLRAFDGIAAAAIWPTLIAAVSGSVPSEKRTMAMSVMTVTYIAGVAMGPLLGGVANDTAYRLTGDLLSSKLTSFYLVSALFLATALVAWFLTPHRSREEMESRDGVKERSFRLGDILIGVRAVPDMMILAFITFFGIGLLIPIIKFFAMDELRLSETGFGLMILPIAVTVAGASILSGRLGDSWGKVRSVRLGIALAAFAMWIVPVSVATWQFAVAGMMLGVGFVIAMPAWLALVSDMASPRCRGTVVGALGTAQGIGAVLGNVFGSYLYTTVAINLFGRQLSSHYSPFILCAVALSVCLVLVFVFIKEHETRYINCD